MTNDYLSAVDIVCMDCDYCEEQYCKNCPVQKTVDRLKKEQEKSQANTEIYDLASKLCKISDEEGHCKRLLTCATCPIMHIKANHNNQN